MISAYYGYSFTQDNIYKKMGGINGDTTGISPQRALTWYKLSRSSGGLGATRSYAPPEITITKAKQEIDYHRPFSSHTRRHCRACIGYWVFYDGSGTDCIYLNDPATSGPYWEAVSNSPETNRIYVIF